MISTLRAAGKQVGVVVPVDMLGKTVDYDAIPTVANESGVKVLADTAES